MNTALRLGSLLLLGCLALAGTARAAPPVINNPDTHTFTFDRDTHDLAYPYRFQTTGATSVTVSAFTQTLGTSNGGSEPLFDQSRGEVWFPVRPATWRFTIIATNADGETRKDVTVHMWPIESIFSESIGSGVYRPGDVIRITVVYWLPVTVSGGTPYFGLTLEGRPLQAFYVGGSGTDTLRFEYVVRPPDAGRVEIGAVQNNGATITLSNGQAANNLVPTANWRIGFPSIRIEGPDGRTPQTIEFLSGVSAYVIGQPTALSATSSAGLPVTFSVVSGSARVDGNLLTITGPGNVIVRASQAGTATIAPASADITVSGVFAAVSTLVNVSSRLPVVARGGSATVIAGFTITGDGSLPVLLRAAGPALGVFGIANPLPNPRLALFNARGELLAENDDWSGAAVANAAVSAGAFSFPAGSRDAAITTTLPAGGYTLHVIANGASGIALAEVYSLASAEGSARPALTNISTRGVVEPGEGVLTAGFVITGNTAKRVLVRAAGPALIEFGVTDTLVDPRLRVQQGDRVVGENDDWQGSNAAEITAAGTATGAFAFTPGSRDAAVVLLLPPGPYTAMVTGANGATGVALVEVYEVP